MGGSSGETTGLLSRPQMLKILHRLHNYNLLITVFLNGIDQVD